jgi:DNA primase
LRASTIADFFFQTLTTQADINSTDGRARYVKLANDLIKQIPAGVFHEMMLDELSRRARIDIKKINPTAARPAAALQRRAAPLAAKQPSPLRLAMTLLIQQPSLVGLISEPLPVLDMSGFELLTEIIALAEQNPSLSAGALIERFRGRDEWEMLNKLMNWQHMIPETGVQHEFTGAIKQLRKLAQDHVIDQLLSKAALAELSLEEKQMLSELINNKQ